MFRRPMSERGRAVRPPDGSRAYEIWSLVAIAAVLALFVLGSMLGW